MIGKKWYQQWGSHKFVRSGVVKKNSDSLENLLFPYLRKNIFQERVTLHTRVFPLHDKLVVVQQVDVRS